jgi:hypothetical protein
MTREQQIDWLCRLKSEIKIFMPYQWQKPFQEALDMAIKTPEQEPKTGHWKYFQNEKGDWMNVCSNCNLDCGVGYPYNYCPNCGAEMESEE